MESHLLQMRGLKPKCNSYGRHRQVYVASFTDAWIETVLHADDVPHPNKKSHLLQMRGLKPSPGGVAKKLLVASFTDAWIETINIRSVTPARLSHLLQMRGLKLLILSLITLAIKSHLLQMRGLKLFKYLNTSF